MRGDGHVGFEAWTKALPVLLALAGIALAGLGLTRLVAALVAAPGTPVLSALGDDRPVSDAALERLLDSRRSALVWSRSPGFYRDMARAEWLLAQRAGSDGGAAASAFRSAADATEDGLRLAPADPVSWLRLAAIRLDVDANPEAALAALRAAVRSGPYDPYRTGIRIRMILRLWPRLDGSDRVLFRPQFAHLWDDEPEALARLALDQRAYLITLAMLDDAEVVEQLTAMRDELARSLQ